MEWYYIYLIFHGCCFLLTLSTIIFTEKYITVGDVILAIVFGPVGTLYWFSNLDNIVIDIRPRDKK